jgi:hypothetical protein
MIFVLEALVRSDEIEFISIFLAQSRQDINLDLTLAGVRRMIFQDLDGYYFVSTFLPAFHHLLSHTCGKLYFPVKAFHYLIAHNRVHYLPEGTTAKELEDFVLIT